MLSSTGTGTGTGSDQSNYNYNTTSNNSSTNTRKRVASSSTNSSWSSSSPSPFSQQPSSLQTPKRTMEEVWKEINLASLSETTPNRRSSLLNHINLPHGTHDPNFRNLQDFLARPFSHNEPPVSLVSTPTEQATLNSPASPLPPSAPPTVLSLTNSGSDHFQLFYASDPLMRPPSSEFHRHRHHQHHQSNPNNISSSVSNSLSASPFVSLAASSSGLPSFGKRAFPDSDHSNSGGDQRHNRMIKNRESAARSRARKQECISLIIPAYTNELELEVARLTEENTRLKRLQEQLCFAAASQQRKKHNVHRSSTAPF